MKNANIVGDGVNTDVLHQGSRSASVEAARSEIRMSATSARSVGEKDFWKLVAAIDRRRSAKAPCEKR